MKHVLYAAERRGGEGFLYQESAVGRVMKHVVLNAFGSY